MVRQRHQFFPSRDICDQRILEFDWPLGKPGHIRPIVVVLHATFPQRLSP